MKLRQLGRSELHVSPVIYGAWAIGGWFWGPTDDQAAIDSIHAALDLGINTIDTAPMYGYGHSEKIVGQAIAGQRDKVIVATKCGLRWDVEAGVFFFEPEPGVKVYRNLTKKSIIAECEQSLKRLNIDAIDLYQCHWPDKSTLLAETMEAMEVLISQGKIRAVGVSNFTVEMIKSSRELIPIASDQPKYNLLHREIEQNVLPYCRANNVGVLAYSPLEQGMLTGTVTPDRQFPKGDWRAKLPWFQPDNRHRVLEALAKVQPIADKYRATLAQVAINWLIYEPGVTAAIVGIRSRQQAAENAGVIQFELTAAERKEIRAIFEAVPKAAGAH